MPRLARVNVVRSFHRQFPGLHDPCPRRRPRRVNISAHALTPASAAKQEIFVVRFSNGHYNRARIFKFVKEVVYRMIYTAGSAECPSIVE
jgi:hypothetical protein